MKKQISGLIIIATLLLNGLVCMAEEKINNPSFIVDVNDGESTIYKADLTGIDNSSLQVRVVRYINDVETTIFTGNLGDYENGAWSNTDFSKIQFLMVLDWNSDDVIYIIPTEVQNSNSDINNVSQTPFDYNADNTKSESMPLDSSETAETSVDYDYSIRKIEIKKSDGTLLNSIKDGAVLSSVVVVKNNIETAPAKIFVALYDNGRLKDIKSVGISETQVSNTEIKYDLNIPLSNINENSSVKIMIWDNNGNLKPYSLNISAFPAYTIDVSTVVGQLYTIPVSTNSGCRTYKIKYDKNFFAIDNLCKTSENKITSTGSANSSINIDEINDDNFTFSFIGNELKECINYISLKALKTGKTALGVFEISGQED